jgi:sporulation protein YlmC with PRC-barrel domain
MSILRTSAFLTLTSVVALSLPAHAQTQDDGAREQTSRNSQCVQQLERLAERMGGDGYWLAGYSGATAGGYGTRYPYRSAGAQNRGADPAVNTEDQANVDSAAGDATTAWSGVTWQQRPQYEIGVLYRAANVLASNGNEEACATVADAAEAHYNNYASQLTELGVKPEDVSSWRQAEIATAVPVEQVGFPRRIEDVIGSDVRNAQDEDLGDIEDVVLDPESGNVSYVIVSTGGFFGIGDEDVAVPWEHLHVTPRLGTFVLPVEQVVLEQAPSSDYDGMIDEQQTGSINTDAIDSYWRDAVGNAEN